ncbi:A1 family peptidase [Bradyrhizobium manausense]|nr:A1 family peptidase [Bradyrhizobium manausense]
MAKATTNAYLPKALVAPQLTHAIHSAAAALGGKISTTTVRMPITNVLNDGDYSGRIYVGNKKVEVDVLLDTGSSTLAVDGHIYDPTKDSTAELTNIGQEIGYEDGSRWVGGIVLTDISVNSAHPLTLPKVHTAVAYHATKEMFGRAHGILGLAYARLNEAYRMPGPTTPPHYTYNQIQHGHRTYIEPYFSQLEGAGLVANKFAFYTLRSSVSMATAKPATDPQNSGFLILGGGEEQIDLYDGAFQVARVVHDTYYNVNLRSVTVGNTVPVEAFPPTKASGDASNAVVDSGTTGIYLDRPVFKEVLARFKSLGFEDEIHAGYLPMSKLKLADWPVLTFVLEGALGSDVTLEVTPQTYWQTDAPKAGHASLAFGSENGPSILGLPLMNNYFTVFDRSINKGLGVVSFARIK